MLARVSRSLIVRILSLFSFDLKTSVFDIYAVAFATSEHASESQFSFYQVLKEVFRDFLSVFAVNDLVGLDFGLIYFQRNLFSE